MNWWVIVFRPDSKYLLIAVVWCGWKALGLELEHLGIPYALDLGQVTYPYQGWLYQWKGTLQYPCMDQVM